MGEEPVWAIAGSLGRMLDFSNYTMKDWLQLLVAAFGIVGSVVGAWKWWRYSKWQIVNRLFEHLNADERNVTEGRRIVLEYLRAGRRSPLNSDTELHQMIRRATKLLDANRIVEAEAALNGFALMLKGSAEVGRRHMAVASEQAATILLFVAWAIRRALAEDPTVARSWSASFRSALGAIAVIERLASRSGRHRHMPAAGIGDAAKAIEPIGDDGGAFGDDLLGDALHALFLKRAMRRSLMRLGGHPQRSEPPRQSASCQGYRRPVLPPER